MKRFKITTILSFIFSINCSYSQISVEPLFEPIKDHRTLSILDEKLNLLSLQQANGLVGVINFSGETIIPPIFSKIEILKDEEQIVCKRKDELLIFNIKGQDITSKKSIRQYEKSRSLDDEKKFRKLKIRLESLHPQLKVEKSSQGITLSDLDSGTIDEFPDTRITAKIISDSILEYSLSGKTKLYNLYSNKVAEEIKIAVNDTTWIVKEGKNYSLRKSNKIEIPENNYIKITTNSSKDVLVLVDKKSDYFLASSDGILIDTIAFSYIYFLHEMAICDIGNGTIKIYNLQAKQFEKSEYKIVRRLESTSGFIIKNNANDIGVFNVEKNDIVIPIEYRSIDYKGGYYFSKRKVQGISYITLLNGDVFNSKYEKIVNYSEYPNGSALGNYLQLQSDSTSIVIDKNGNLVKEGLAKIRNTKGKYFVGLVKNEKLQYTSVDNYVFHGDISKYFDEIVSTLKIDDDLSMFIVKKNKKFGLVDKNGKIYLDCIYDRIVQSPWNKKYVRATADQSYLIFKIEKTESNQQKSLQDFKSVADFNPQSLKTSEINEKKLKLTADGYLTKRTCDLESQKNHIIDKTRLINSVLAENSSRLKDSSLHILYEYEVITKKELKHYQKVSESIKNEQSARLEDYITLHQVKALLSKEEVRRHIVEQAVSFQTSYMTDFETHHEDFIKQKIGLSEYLAIELELTPLKLLTNMSDINSIEANTFEVFSKIYNKDIRVRKHNNELQIHLSNLVGNVYKVPLDIFPNFTCKETDKGRVCTLEENLNLKTYVPIILQVLLQTQLDKGNKRIYNIGTLYDYLDINFDPWPLLSMFPELDVLGNTYYISRCYENLKHQTISFELSTSKEHCYDHLHFNSFGQTLYDLQHSISNTEKMKVFKIISDEYQKMNIAKERIDLERNKLMFAPTNSKKAVLSNLQGSFSIGFIDYALGLKEICKTPLSDYQDLITAVGDDYNFESHFVEREKGAETVTFQAGNNSMQVKSMNEIYSYINRNLNNQSKGIYFIESLFGVYYYIYIEKAIALRINETFDFKLKLID